jgi:hypothetical protein
MCVSSEEERRSEQIDPLPNNHIPQRKLTVDESTIRERPW